MWLRIPGPDAGFLENTALISMLHFLEELQGKQLYTLKPTSGS